MEKMYFLAICVDLCYLIERGDIKEEQVRMEIKESSNINLMSMWKAKDFRFSFSIIFLRNSIISSLVGSLFDCTDFFVTCPFDSNSSFSFDPSLFPLEFMWSWDPFDSFVRFESSTTMSSLSSCLVFLFPLNFIFRTFGNFSVCFVPSSLFRFLESATHGRERIMCENGFDLVDDVIYLCIYLKVLFCSLFSSKENYSHISTSYYLKKKKKCSILLPFFEPLSWSWILPFLWNVPLFFLLHLRLHLVLILLSSTSISKTLLCNLSSFLGGLDILLCNARCSFLCFPRWWIAKVFETTNQIKSFEKKERKKERYLCQVPPAWPSKEKGANDSKERYERVVCFEISFCFFHFSSYHCNKNTRWLLPSKFHSSLCILQKVLEVKEYLRDDSKASKKKKTNPRENENENKQNRNKLKFNSFVLWMIIFHIFDLKWNKRRNKWR